MIWRAVASVSGAVRIGVCWLWRYHGIGADCGDATSMASYRVFDSVFSFDIEEDEFMALSATDDVACLVDGDEDVEVLVNEDSESSRKPKPASLSFGDIESID